MLRKKLKKSTATQSQALVKIRPELYYSGLSKHFTYIADNPDIGSNFSFVKESVFRSNYESHAIYYRQEKKGILILRILHQHMDPVRHMS